MSAKSERAAACFDQGFHCAQAVLSTCAPEFGLSRQNALRVAGAFGAGMARTGHTCGAVTGALMVIGLAHGKTEPEDDESRDRTYALAQAFIERFQARHGPIHCTDLLECDLSTEEGLKRAREEGLFVTRCPQFVRAAVEILEQILTHPAE